MPEDLVALSDLKSKFADWDNMADLISRMQQTLVELENINKTAAGSDSIGQQYTQAVEQPTQDLATAMGDVHDTVYLTGLNGQNTSDSLNQANEEAREVAGGTG
jgi:hypothetical protein